MRGPAVAAAACLAVATFVIAPSWVFASTPRARHACAQGYSYGGYASRDGVRGVSASIAAERPPTVASGHAAAWVGVGGIHEARAGASAWLQAGIAAFPHTGPRLYVEEVSVGDSRRFIDLGPAQVRRSYLVSVVETAPEVWQASIDGRQVGRPAYLPTGGGSWRGVVTAESWAGGRAACNSYGYRFEQPAVLGQAWQPLTHGRTLGEGLSRSGGGFAAIT